MNLKIQELVRLSYFSFITSTENIDMHRMDVIRTILEFRIRSNYRSPVTMASSCRLLCQRLSPKIGLCEDVTHN